MDAFPVRPRAGSVLVFPHGGTVGPRVSPSHRIENAWPESLPSLIIITDTQNFRGQKMQTISFTMFFSIHWSVSSFSPSGYRFALSHSLSPQTRPVRCCTRGRRSRAAPNTLSAPTCSTRCRWRARERARDRDGSDQAKAKRPKKIVDVASPVGLVWLGWAFCRFKLF